jgi:hypothetical protein
MLVVRSQPLRGQCENVSFVPIEFLLQAHDLDNRGSQLKALTEIETMPEL